LQRKEASLKKVFTICPYCGCGCGLYLHVDGNTVTGVSPSPSHPVSQGRLCVKGWTCYEFINSPMRLKTPLVKKGGRLIPTDWDEALDRVSQGLKAIKDRYGGDSLGAFSSAKCTNEENFLFMKFVRVVLGTNNIDHCARLCHASTVAGLASAFGSGAMTNSIDDIEDADVILLTGSNTSENHPLIASRIIRAVRDGKTDLIIADPRRIELTRFARLHLQHRCGTDVALLNGLMHVIITEDLHNKGFVKERTEEFDRLHKLVEKYRPEYVERITGVPANDIREAARIYASAPSASIIYAMGITQHTTGTDNVFSCANLAMLTGNIGRRGTGVNPLRGQNNVQGACDMGALPNVYSGYQKVTDEKVRHKFQEAWKVKLPEAPGLTIVPMIKSALEGKLKGLYIMGENPMLSDPDILHTGEALKKLKFLVVQDIFLTETACMADVVLPATTFAEKDGTFTNTERRIQRLRKAIDPVGESLPDWMILCKLSSLMGYPMNYQSPAEIMEEIAELTPIYGGISYERLGRQGLQWPCTGEEHPGTKILHQDRFARGLGKFHPVDYRPPAELRDEKFPYILTTGRMLFHYHTGTMSRKTTLLDREYPEGYVEINPRDAESLGIGKGEKVRVITRRGQIITRARLTQDVPPETIFIPFHFREAAANLLTNPALDPTAEIPEYKICSARIEKC